jgi:hypothetical protein
LRKESILSTIGDYLIRIVRQDNKDFGAISCGYVRSARANGDFALARGAPMPQRFDEIRAESFHCVPASNPFF